MGSKQESLPPLCERSELERKTGLTPELWTVVRHLFKEESRPSQKHPGRFRAFYIGYEHQRAPNAARRVSKQDWNRLLNAMLSREVLKKGFANGESVAYFDKNPDILTRYESSRERDAKLMRLRAARDEAANQADSVCGNDDEVPGSLTGFHANPSRFTQVLVVLREAELSSEREHPDGVRISPIATTLKERYGWPDVQNSSFATTIKSMARLHPGMLTMTGALVPSRGHCYVYGLTDLGRTRAAELASEDPAK